MTDAEKAVLRAAREFAAANRALEAGERYAVTRVNRATAALHKAAWLVGQDGKVVCRACEGEGYVNIKGSEYYRTCRMCVGGLVNA